MTPPDRYTEKARELCYFHYCTPMGECEETIAAALQAAAAEARAEAFEECARIVEKRYRERDAYEDDQPRRVTMHCAQLIRARAKGKP